MVTQALNFPGDAWSDSDLGIGLIVAMVVFFLYFWE